MLFANQFFAGSLDMATAPSLILPRSKYEEPFLIGLTGSGPTAVFLDGQNRFRSMSAAGNKDWHGVIVPQIRVAVCAKHIVDPNHAKEPGMMVRIGTKLAICTRDARGFGMLHLLTIEDGHADGNDHQAGFQKWQIVLGEGPDRTVLWSYDATTQ